MYTHSELELAEKFAMEILDYAGFQDILDSRHIEFWVSEIERIQQAKQYHDAIALLDLTQTCVYDPFEGVKGPDPIY